jgi:hypothetical protein
MRVIALVIVFVFVLFNLSYAFNQEASHGLEKRTEASGTGLDESLNGTTEVTKEDGAISAVSLELLIKELKTLRKLLKERLNLEKNQKKRLETRRKLNKVLKMLKVTKD